MAYTIIKPADRQAWLAQREKGIGSSEVGTILGVNPFQTPYQLWRRKKGLDAPIQENEAMRAGHILEGAVATYFEEETGREVIKASAGDWLAVDKEKDYLRVSPDRTYWLEGKHSKDNKGILEIKTTQLDIDSDELPPHWYCQLSYQLGVMGYRQGSLAWLTRGRKFGYADIRFDPDFYDYMVGKLTQFWVDYIQGDKEPPATSIEDVCLKFPRSIGKAIEANDEVMEAVNNLKMVKTQIDELNKQKKEAEDLIKTFMADSDTLCLAGTKESNPVVVATWKTAKDTLKFDQVKFSEECPAIFEKYLTNVTGSRRFLLK